MRLLQGLRQHMPQRIVEVLAVVLAGAVLEHREDRLHGLVEYGALVLHRAAERLELGDGRALPHAELDAAVAEEIEHGNALCDTDWIVGGDLEDAVAETDVLGALAGGGEE